MNKSRAKILIYNLLAIGLLANSACNVSRKAFKEPIKEQGAAFLIDNLKQKELKFKNLSAKFNVDYQIDNKETKVSGIVRIEHDSIIWVSITPALGLEALRFELTPDSVKFLNRISNTYFEDGFSAINQLLNKTLDFDMVQAFLTGNDFSLYESHTFKASIDNQQYKLSTTDRRKLKRYVRRSNDDISIPIQFIWLDPESFKISKVILKEAERDSRKFEATYSDFTTVKEQSIPSSINYRIETGEQKIKISIVYSKISVDQEQSYPFRIPDNYSRIEDLHFKK